VSPRTPEGDRFLHPWEVSIEEARAIQRRLRDQVRVESLDVDAIQTVAGADLSFGRGSDDVFAGIVVLRLPGLEVVERAGVRTKARFPYVPGLLSFRETPPLLEAWQRLTSRPDALICDGHGQAHPRRFGIACHVGLLLDLPTVGCAKSILVGRHPPVGEEVGDWAPLVHGDADAVRNGVASSLPVPGRAGGEVVGAALRLRARAAPVYVSVGHRCDLESALALVRRCAGPTRVPETTRQAHLFVNALRRGEIGATTAG
jgi:deoxyribonuclease V